MFGLRFTWYTLHFRIEHISFHVVPNAATSFSSSTIKKKLRGFGPLANYADRATAAS
jgi:hypothetical protein